MARRLLVIAFGALALAAAGTALLRRGALRAPVAPAEVDASAVTCVQCHAAEAVGYARTGMAHAFSLPNAINTVEAPAPERTFHHAVSGTNFSMLAHDGRYFQRRWLTGLNGQPDSVEELQIDYVMGSGNHARTYLHRESDGTLIELPLAWYPENGGRWAMNPGFDNAHPMTRRPIAYECMFCHNAYPQIPPSAHRDLPADPVYLGSLPLGIDCARCHGPGQAHVRMARTPQASIDSIRSAIVNPARLNENRQMEVCEQCHLETTSRLLPDRIRHYDRLPFSYNVGEPLANFISYFERDPAHGRTDNFEIVSAPYRLRQSQCYLKSEGALTCETCHNPHDLHKGTGSAQFYTAICMKCHAATLPAKIAAQQHPASTDCVSCHMPKRRTEDVVHAVMTDHLIQRRPPPAELLLAERAEIPDSGAEAYHGTVKSYRLDGQAAAPDNALYEATAQVIDGSNLAQGIRALTESIHQFNPAQPDFFIELGDAQRHSSDPQGAIAAYRQAIALDPLSSRAQRRLGVALGSVGNTDQALTVLRTQAQKTPQNALLWYELSLIEFRSGSLKQAIDDMSRSLALKPDLADGQNQLGAMLAQTGAATGAEAAFRVALTVNPYDAPTRSNLGRLLGSRNDWPLASFEFGKAVEFDPTDANAHADYATALAQLQRFPEALTQAQAAVAADPASARLHDLLGNLFAQKLDFAKARAEYQAALTRDAAYGPAQIDLALTLIQLNDIAPARALLVRAQSSPSPQTQDRARDLLHQLNPR